MKSGRQPTLMSYLNVAECIDAQSIEQQAKFPNKNLLANGNEILAGDTVTLLGTTVSQLRMRLPASAGIDLKAPPAKDDRFHCSSAERLADKLRAGRRVGPTMLHQCPCGRIGSFIGLFGSRARLRPPD
jgi:hypothetical protein